LVGLLILPAGDDGLRLIGDDSDVFDEGCRRALCGAEPAGHRRVRGRFSDLASPSIDIAKRGVDTGFWYGGPFRKSAALWDQEAGEQRRDKWAVPHLLRTAHRPYP
jgi:hypothetical protein